MSPDLEQIQEQEYVHEEIRVNAMSSDQGCVPWPWIGTEDLVYRSYYIC
jgi:hypothetical protein